MTDWRRRARALSDHLAKAGELRTPAWREVFAAVPRHVFVPCFYEQGEWGQWERVDGDDPEQHDRWLDAVYSDTTLVTAVVDVELPAHVGPYQAAVSSSTLPGLMAQMLEDLDLRDGHTVLEIGTGTGYNAALLSERLGDRHVFSVDLRPDLVEAAAARLARAGYQPTLATGDGADGLTGYAPYDRIIATCSVQHIPPRWIEQLRLGGLLLVDVEGTMAAGNLVALHRHDGDVVEGRFRVEYGTYMAMAHQLDVPAGQSFPTDTTNTTERTTALGPELVHELHRPLAFFTQLHLPPGTQLQLTGAGDDTATRLVAPDGSWCEVGRRPDAGGRHRVLEGGQLSLWREVERARERYVAVGQPDWQRFGLTASRTDQHVWLDEPNGEMTWAVDTTGAP